MTHTKRSLDCLIKQMNTVISSTIKALICHTNVLYKADSSIVVLIHEFSLKFISSPFQQ